MEALEIRGRLDHDYADVFTSEALTALEALAALDADRKAVMSARIGRRLARARSRERITFLDPQSRIPRTHIRVEDARAGGFVGSDIPADLRRQWIQGTGPAARPNARVGRQHQQRRLRVVVRRRWLDVRRRRCAGTAVHDVARQPAQPQAGHSPRPGVHDGGRTGGRRDERVGQRVLRAADHRRLEEAARLHDEIFRPRGLHLDDRHIRQADGAGFSASIVDVILYVTNNHAGFGRLVPRWSCICPRFRRPKKRRCGTTSWPASKRTSAWRPRRSRCTCWLSSSRPAFS